MLIASENISPQTLGLGPKTINLKKLVDLGCKVPSFCAISAEEVKNLAGKSTTSEEFVNLVAELEAQLPALKFVVRSSALIEDSAKNSYAGQFLTKIDVSLENIPQAILEVIVDAGQKLSGDLSKFSIIIQEYIPADTSGVCFTRDPLGNRYMVVEYHQGIGEDIVSGKVKPDRFTVLWNSTPSSKWVSVVETFRKIEHYYEHPQDIEWVMKGGVLHIVQTRPITTISAVQYSGMLYLDKTLPETPFLFEKTEISEIAPRPTELTLDLLKRIYAPNGPVSNVYKNYKINYSSQDFLKTIGNELYVDRELELQTLFPSFSYLKSGTPHFSKLDGVFRTFVNMVRINRVDRDTDQLFAQLQEALSKPLVADKKLALDFLADYELIFEINLLAAKALKTLDIFASKEKLNPALLLLAGNNDGANYQISVDSQSWRGNSLEISDETAFYAVRAESSLDALVPSLESLSKVKQMYIGPVIKKAQAFSKLREYGRWLTVKYVSALREYALSKAVNYTDPKNIYFSTIDELSVVVAEKTLIDRKSKYDSFVDFNFPNRVTNLPAIQPLALMAVSTGTAEGILKSPDQMLPEDRNIVLYTKVLSPELTKYFPQICGIVSEQGGLLSHLAILAREKNLPVLVNYDNSVALGSKVKIDCVKSSIEVI